MAEYSGLLGIFLTLFAGFLATARASNRPIPERISAGDTVLLGVATYKLSRMLTKDLVTRPLREHFTEFECLAGEGEVNEKPRGEGMQRAVGELVSCPFCLGTWVAAFFVYGLVFSPNVTRLIATMLTAQTLSDFLHLGFTAAAKADDSAG